MTETPKTLTDYSTALGMPVEKAIELWRAKGAPVIHLGQGAKCLDLAKLLSLPSVSPEHLAATKNWLGGYND